MRYLIALPLCLGVSEAASAVVQDPLVPQTVVVTGTRLPVASQDLSTDITVIDRDMLSQLDKSTVTDVLRSVPGLQVSQQGGPGGVTNVYVRGGESNFAIVMLDGVQVNDPTDSRGGSFDFSSLDVDSIERIEIVRGPQSALYGQGALAGVINIVTREGSREIENTFGSGVGVDGYHQLGYQLTGSWQERLAYALGAHYKDYGEPVSGSRKELTTLTGKSAYRLSNQTSLDGGIYFASTHRTSFPEDSGGPGFAVSRELDREQSTDLAINAGWSHQIDTQWLTTLRGSWYRREDDASSPGIYPFLEVPPNFTTIDFERANLSWVNVVTLGSRTRASFGADADSERGKSVGYLDFSGLHVPTSFELQRKVLGLFAELQADFADGTSLNGSIRHDNPDSFAQETTYKIGVRHDLEASGTTLRANWGTAFKLPSFFALGHALVGNPNLKPERNRSYDVGLTRRIGGTAAATLSLFRDDFEDLIDFDPVAFKNVNRGRVRTQGAELQIDCSPLPDLQMRAHASYLDIDVAQAGVKLRGRPPWMAGMQAHWQFRAGVALNLDYEWVDEVFEASQQTGVAVLSTLQPYHRVDVNLSWQAAPQLDLQLAIDNVLGESYSQAVGFPAPGIQPRVSVRYRL